MYVDRIHSRRSGHWLVAWDGWERVIQYLFDTHDLLHRIVGHAYHMQDVDEMAVMKFYTSLLLSPTRLTLYCDQVCAY